jgi:hypothetical protein
VFRCEAPDCDWERDDADDDGLWALAFSHRMGRAGLVPDETLGEVA